MVLIHAIVVKIRDGQASDRPIYVAIGVNPDGERDVLSYRVGPSGGEVAEVWMGRLTELRSSGIGTPSSCAVAVSRASRMRCGRPGPRRCVAVRRAAGSLVVALHLQEALGAGVPGAARDLHSVHPRCRRGPLLRLRRDLARLLPRD